MAEDSADPKPTTEDKAPEPPTAPDSKLLAFYGSSTTKYWLLPLMVLVLVGALYKGFGLIISGLKVGEVEVSFKEAGETKEDGDFEKTSNPMVMTISFWAPSEKSGPYLMHGPLPSAPSGPFIAKAADHPPPEVVSLINECGQPRIDEYIKLPASRHTHVCDSFIYMMDVSNEKVLAFDQKIRGIRGVQGFNREETIGMGRSIERLGNFYHVTFVGKYDKEGQKWARKAILSIYEDFFHRDRGIWMEVQLINGDRT
jgi:hypothetical protein